MKWTTEQRKILDLIPYEHNPRKITPEQAEQLTKSLQRFDLVEIPAINTDGVIIAGHQRLAILKALGRGEEVVDVRVPSRKLTEAELKEYNLRSNKNVAEWDFDILTKHFDIEMLKNVGFDMKDIPESEILIGSDADDAPAPPKKAKTKLGNIYTLEQHRLMCGDSTNQQSIATLVGKEYPDMIFTDPPYGVSIGDKNKMLNSVQPSGRCIENISNDTLSPEKLYPILLAAFKNAATYSKDKCAFYVASPQGGGLGMMMMMMMKDSGLEVRHVLNWVKNSPTFSLGRLDYDYQHEPILFTWKKTHKKIMHGEHKTSCWFIDKPRESKLHPTMKPVAIPENAILNSSETGDIVLDMFGGAGSTLIACEKTKRRCRMMELDPIYCDVIVKRWEEYTGKKAVLDK